MELTCRTFRVDTGPWHLAVHDWGGAGSPILLAHPTGFHGRVWAPVAERLLAAGQKVWSFDFHGHGDSEALDGDSYSWLAFANDVVAVATHLDLLGNPDLVAAGHSKGGTALLLAEAARPGSFARIWAYEPIVFPTATVRLPDDDFPLARAARKRRDHWPSIDAAYEAYASKPPLSAMTPETLRAYVEYGLQKVDDGTFVLKCRPADEAQMFTMSPANGLWDQLGAIKAPVRVVCGETSTSIPPVFGARIVEQLGHGSLEVMPGLGHFGPQQDPDAAAASILAFRLV